MLQRREYISNVITHQFNLGGNGHPKKESKRLGAVKVSLSYLPRRSVQNDKHRHARYGDRGRYLPRLGLASLFIFKIGMKLGIKLVNLKKL